MTDDGIPRWFGRLFRNELVNMPMNEQKRIIQVLTDRTKRTALKECIVPGRHKGKIAEGHNIQEAVMRRLTRRTTIMSFACLPVVSKRHFPEEVEISHATTGYFACREHENLFADIEREVPDFGNAKHLLLLAYKALLKGTWDAKLARVAWAAVEAEDPESDMPNYMARLHREMEEGVGYYKYVAEEMLGIAEHPSPYESAPNVLKHIVLRVPSRVPTVAVSSWTNGLGYRVTPTPYGPIIERIAQWGCTVYPMENEHVVVYHFPVSDEGTIRDRTRAIRLAKDAVLQRRVSQQLLERFEDIVISPEVWDSFSEDKRITIRDYFAATLPDMGIRTPSSFTDPAANQLSAKRLRLVNLFDGTLRTA